MLQASLRYERNLILQGEVWRMLTAHFVHLNLTHLALNLSGWCLFIWLCGHLYKPQQLSLTILWIALGISAALLLFHPEVHWYLGFSGVLYGLLVAGGLQLMLRQERWLGLTLIGFICLKMAWDSYTAQHSYSAQLIGAPVLLAAHWYGMLLGAVASLTTLYKNK